MRNIRRLLAAFGIIALIGLACSCAPLFAQATAPSGGDCGSYFVMTQPANNQQVEKTINIDVSTSTQTTTTAAVQFKFDATNIGGVVTNQSGGLWRTPWDTTTVPNGPHQLSALVNMTSGTCVTNPITVTVNNMVTAPPTSGTLQANLQPASWNGPKNANYSFEAQAYYSATTTSNVTAAATYIWSTSIGVVQGSGNVAQFYSGSRAGDGIVTVNIAYNGQSTSRTVAVHVLDSTNSTYPATATATSTNTPTGSSSSTGASATDPSHTTATPSGGTSTSDTSHSEGDSKLQACLQQKLGNESYQQFLVAKRLTAAQYNLAHDCFVIRDNTVPANLAPVDPAKITALPVDSTVKIEKPIKSISKERPGIVFEGTAGANANVLLYIFSDPLVLSTTADSSGRWSYTLTNPMEPGNHEAYVVVEGENAYKRSEVLGFKVAKANASAANPDAYSLDLVENNNAATIWYMAGGAGLIGVALLFLVRYIWFRKKKPAANTEPSGTANEVAPVEPPAPVAPAPSAAPPVNEAPEPPREDL